MEDGGGLTLKYLLAWLVTCLAVFVFTKRLETSFQLPLPRALTPCKNALCSCNNSTSPDKRAKIASLQFSRKEGERRKIKEEWLTLSVHLLLWYFGPEAASPIFRK